MMKLKALLLLMLLLGCAPKVTHREYIEYPAEKMIPDLSTNKMLWCTLFCGKCPDSTSVHLANADFQKCENDPHSICMIDCLKLPLAQIQELPIRSTNKP